MSGQRHGSHTLFAGQHVRVVQAPASVRANLDAVGCLHRHLTASVKCMTQQRMLRPLNSREWILQQWGHGPMQWGSARAKEGKVLHDSGELSALTVVHREPFSYPLRAFLPSCQREGLFRRDKR